ncbi:MAG: c-type cytochrome [Bacteroidota bacterium]
MTEESMNRAGTGVLLLIFLALAIGILANIRRHPQPLAEQPVAEADPVRAPAAIAKYGCGSCHQIPRIAGADGRVGPALANLSRRSMLAGQLPNNPENLVLWIEHPQLVRPGSDMPELNVSDADARDIAAYLYSLH